MYIHIYIYYIYVVLRNILLYIPSNLASSQSFLIPSVDLSFSLHQQIGISYDTIIVLGISSGSAKSGLIVQAICFAESEPHDGAHEKCGFKLMPHHVFISYNRISSFTLNARSFFLLHVCSATCKILHVIKICN